MQVPPPTARAAAAASGDPLGSSSGGARWPDSSSPACCWRSSARSCRPGSITCPRNTPSWGYFVGLIAGLVGSVWISPPLLARRGIGWTLAFACGLSSVGVRVSGVCLAAVFAVVARGRAGADRIGGGRSAHGDLSRHFADVPARSRGDHQSGGHLFGLGCLTVALLISGTFYIYTAAAIQAWIAVIPALFGWLYVQRSFASRR